MTISDEWHIPEKQPFKDLVRGWEGWPAPWLAGQAPQELPLPACVDRPPGARGRNTASWMKVDETYSVPCLWFFFQGNLRYWLKEAECRDQYSVIFESGDHTSIFWNDVKDPVSIEERAVGIRCPWGLTLSFRSRKPGTRAWFSVMFFQTASLRTTSFALLVLK